MLLAAKKKLIRNLGELPTEGLIHNWPLQGDFLDYAGSKNWSEVGSVSFGTNRNGEPNKAAVFVDQNNYLEFSTDLDIGNVFSVSFWLYFDDTKNPMILNKWSTGAIAYIWTSGNRLTFRLSTGSTDILSNFDSSIWYHIVLTRDGTDLKYYINNGSSLDGIASGTGNSIIKVLNTRYNYSPDDLYSVIGKMSDVRIYNRIISSDEITALYNE